MGKMLGVASEWYDPVRMEVYDAPDASEGTPYTIVLRPKWWHPFLWWIAIRAFVRVSIRSIRLCKWD